MNGLYISGLRRIAARVKNLGCWWVLCRRLGRLAVVSTKFAALVAVLDPLGRLIGRFAPVGPVRLRQYFESLGGSFTKLGQMLALQPDLIPIPYCDELFCLLDRVRPFPFSEVQRIILEELGSPIESLFDSFDSVPLATASIGQVHLAMLHGQRVAVKVQRPAAQAEMVPDLRISALIVRLIWGLRVAPLYWLLEPLEEFVRWSWEELDCRYEARYTQRARQNARGRPFERVPKVYEALTRRRLLTVEFLPGVTVLNLLRATGGGVEARTADLPYGFRRSDYCNHIIQNFLAGAFENGFFHADLHPANLMILKDNIVGYVDFGITGVLSEYSRQNLVALTLAYAENDPGQMFEIFLRISTLAPDSDLDLLERGLRRCVRQWPGSEAGGTGRASITMVMLDWLQLSRAAHVLPQRDVIKYIRCAIALDGLIKRLDPAFDVGGALAEAARGHLQTMVKEQLFSRERLDETFAELAQVLASGPTVMRRLLDATTDSARFQAEPHSSSHRQAGRARAPRR